MEANRTIDEMENVYPMWVRLFVQENQRGLVNTDVDLMRKGVPLNLPGSPKDGLAGGGAMSCIFARSCSRFLSAADKQEVQRCRHGTALERSGPHVLRKDDHRGNHQAATPSCADAPSPMAQNG